MRAERVPPGVPALPVCREVVVDLGGAREGRLARAGQEDREARGSRHPRTEANLSLSTWRVTTITFSSFISRLFENGRHSTGYLYLEVETASIR